MAERSDWRRWQRSPERSATIYVRTTPELHRLAAERAEAQGESVTCWALSIVARHLGLPKPPRTRRRVDVHSFTGVLFLRTSPQLHERAKEAAAAEGLHLAHWTEGLLARELAAEPRSPQALAWLRKDRA